MTDFHGPITSENYAERYPRQSVLLSALGPSFLNPLQYKYITPLIQPHFDYMYCAPFWDGLNSYICEKLQKLQNQEARVILHANCGESLRGKVCLLSLKHRSGTSYH